MLLLFFIITFLVAAEVMKFLCLNEVIVLLVTITGAFSGESNKKCVNVLTRTMLLLLFLHIGIGIFLKVVFNVISSFLLNVYVVNRLIRNLTYTKHKTNTIAFYGRPLPPKIHEFQTIQARNRWFKCPLQNSTDN